jgi:hypothetical protein
MVIFKTSGRRLSAATVGSTPTRFRQYFQGSLGSHSSLRISARGSDAAQAPQVRLPLASADSVVLSNPRNWYQIPSE